MERESRPLGLGNPGKRSYFECMKAISTAFPWPISPAESLRRFVRYGLLSAFVFAMAADARLFDVSNECRGDFSSAFSRDFDVRRCNLTVRSIGSDLKFNLPFP
jgi:hypothetical protein